jgi:predicted CopG family antitoxin
MTRPVSLSNAAYSTLQKMKGKGMSFSDVILKMAGESRPKRSFLKFAGSLKSESIDLESFKKQIEEDRKKNTDRKW